MSQLSHFGPERLTNASIFKGTGGGVGHAQLARLFRIILILQSKKFPNARELSELCEVSRRTVYRDIEVLIEAGVPVRFRHERQGYELTKGFFLPPLGMEPGEAFSLLVLARTSARGGGLNLAKLAWTGASKLVEALPAEIREYALSTAEAFVDEAVVTVAMPDREAIHDAIVDALSSQRQLRLRYAERKSLSEACTKFALYRVVMRGEIWFLVGRSSLHRRIEVIGIPWVREAVVTDEPYVIPQRFNLKRFLGLAWGVDHSPIRYRVWLRFSAKVAPEVVFGTFRRDFSQHDVGDGRIDLQFSVDGIEELARWVLSFGDEVEVLAPPELRDRIFEIAVNLSRMHTRELKSQHPPTVNL